MPLFSYVTRDASGNRTVGEIEGEGEAQVVAKLRSSGFSVISIQEKQPGFLEKLRDSLRFSVSQREVILYIRQLSVMLRSGMSLLPSLHSLIKQTKDPLFKKIQQDIAADIDGGMAFSKAMAKHPDTFPLIYTSMVEAGEEAGILSEVLARMAIMGGKELDIKARVKSAMTYPIILFSIASLVLIGMMIFVIPKIKGMFAKMHGNRISEIPITTKILFAFTDFLQEYYIIALILFVVSIIVFVKYFKSESGQKFFDRLFLKLPVFGPLLIKTSIARFARTLSSLSKSGLSISQSLRIVQNTMTNSVIAENVGHARRAITDGVSISQAFAATGIFPEMIIQMMSVGEETGSLDEMLDEVAEFYDTEVDLVIRNLVTMLEPFILVVMGAIVGFMALALLVPMFTAVRSYGSK